MERPGPAEYLVLRQTIAHRGALRPILMLAGTGLWGAALIAVLGWLPYPAAAAIPLLILVTTFEVIRPLHFGAERIGRYVQVFHEEAGHTDRSIGDVPSWERVAMQFGAVPGVGGHPLFVPIFLMATVLNFVLVLFPEPEPADMALLTIPHAAFVLWLVLADRAMRRQRPIELARLRALRTSGEADRKTDGDTSSQPAEFTDGVDGH